ncbi:hypothetical protein FOZ61_006936 [Perkinsus olseni]|nr:hypothetical protein FOZ61_006936 [Perkinsus olseni]
MILGLVLVGSAPTFWLLLIGLLFTGSSGSFGAVVLLTYMRRFNPTLTGAITSGSGISAIYAYFLYIILHSTIGITSQHIYYVLLLPATLYIILWNLLKPLPTIKTTEGDSSNAYHFYEGESPEGILSIIKRYLSTFLQRKVWPLCLLLGSTYFMQIMIVGKLVRDSNNLTLQEANDMMNNGGSTWSICHSFEVIGLVYSFGHLLGTTSLPLLSRFRYGILLNAYPYTVVMSLCQWTIWMVNSRAHFLPLYLQYILIFITGLLAGLTYLLIMYKVHSTYNEREKEPVVILIDTTVTLFIITTNAMTYLLDNTFMPPFDNRGCAPTR